RLPPTRTPARCSRRSSADARVRSRPATGIGKRTDAASTSDRCRATSHAGGPPAQPRQRMSRERPLSPHLQVYRWQVQMVTSILHRATGIVLAGGALALAGGLLALMLGPEAWACFSGHAGAWYGQVLLFGWTWAFAYHLCNGIRHIVQDFA